MKKLFLLFATVTLLTVFQACKQKPAEEAPAETTDPTVIDVTPAAAGDSDTTRIPVVPTDPIKTN